MQQSLDIPDDLLVAINRSLEVTARLAVEVHQRYMSARLQAEQQATQFSKPLSAFGHEGPRRPPLLPYVSRRALVTYVLRRGLAGLDPREALIDAAAQGRRRGQVALTNRQPPTESEARAFLDVYAPIVNDSGQAASSKPRRRTQKKTQQK